MDCGITDDHQFLRKNEILVDGGLHTFKSLNDSLSKDIFMMRFCKGGAGISRNYGRFQIILDEKPQASPLHWAVRIICDLVE